VARPFHKCAPKSHELTPAERQTTRKLEVESQLSGTASQVEWAERIKRRVKDDFDRVAASFRSIADGQDDDKRTDTEAIIAILEDKRAEVMSREQAGYSIHDWQETTDQVRQMMFHDARYQAIKANRARNNDEASVHSLP
jgi:hypothetical protein